MEQLSNAKNINDYAMRLLSNGDFESAQKYLYEGKNRFPCAQTYNNLGLFLYENGIGLKNGEHRVATTLGKKYIAQALKLKRDPRIIANIGRILFDEGDYYGAYANFSNALRLKKDEELLYNIAVSLFNSRDYKGCLKCCKRMDNTVIDRIPLYLFSLAFCEKESIENLNSNYFKSLINQMNLLDQMNLLYYCGHYYNIEKSTKELLSQWSLDFCEWAILIDAFIKIGKAKEIDNIMRREICDSQAYGFRKVKSHLILLYNDSFERERTINNFFDTMLFPQIVKCGYFGCILHETRWMTLEK